jgi:branched-subunit amino acid aminotransferase/4-amino-4-deoxychorismate lyase
MATIPITILTPAGSIAPGYSATSLADAAPNEPDGVYTMGRTFKRDHALLFDAHLDRLEESARLEGVNVSLDRPAIRRALRALIEGTDHAESRFRITIPRATPDHVYLSIEPFTPPGSELYETGARVITIEDIARHNPAAKTTAWMAERKSSVEAFPPGVYEGILVGPQGALLEGTSSNFYAVKSEVVYTAGEGVLGGMAQKAVLAVADELGVQVRREPASAGELWALDEAFLTSASRGVVPIVMINTQIIADGQPGPLTTRIRLAYEAWVDAHIEVLV